MRFPIVSHACTLIALVHAIGGTAGALKGNTGQRLIIVSFIILKVIDWTLGLRVKDEQEREGLDITQHGEQVYE
ncbi:hypothetical protein ACSDBR_02165 [Acidithiobacillus ferriphilus]|uniref:hypothetical protein n=1 Tax=Acidithiobacillus ferriphilus TaxID=1689834 RepID=UPI0029C08CBC|nr:hypothetical protein [Acidithiobacillus ferriphilus]